MANDYWAYLREENELKHYRTPGALNKNPIKGTRLPDGTIVYDDKVAAAQARGQARQQQASSAAKSALQNREERQGGKSAQTAKRAAVYNKSSRQTDGGEYGDVAIPGVKYKINTRYGSAAIRSDRNDDGSYDTAESTRVTEDFLGKKIESLNNHANNSVGGKVGAAQARGNARDIAKIKQEAQRNASISKKDVSGDTQQIKKYVKARGRYLEGEAGSRHDNIEAHLGKYGGLAKSGYTITEEYSKNGNFKGHKLTKGGDSRSDIEKRIDNASYKIKEGIKNSLKNVKSKTLGAVDSIKRKLAKKR